MKLPLYTSVDEIDKVVDVLCSKIKEIPVPEAQKLTNHCFLQIIYKLFLLLD